jgi:hypothetical protein
MNGRMPKRLVHSNEREKSSRLASRNSPSRRCVTAIDPQNQLSQMIQTPTLVQLSTGEGASFAGNQWSG